MEGYDLAPISEVWKYDNKEFYYYEKNKLKATVIENNPEFNSIYKNIPAIKVEYFNENNNKVDEEIFRGLQFMKKIADGKFTEVSNNTSEPVKEKQPEPEPKKEKSFKERINVEKTAENFKDIRQSLDEFFTPKWTAQIMFDLAIKHGFKGGSILEPSFGHGVFFDVAIENSSKTELGIKEENLYGFEIYKPNFEVVKKNHPKAKLFDHNFEYQFIDQDIFYRKNKIEKSIDFKNKQFDLVLGNPPYGKHTSHTLFTLIIRCKLDTRAFLSGWRSKN